jgi:4-amino-4-deoxy-L-arabinose transferase-like glycosyltransferase
VALPSPDSTTEAPAFRVMVALVVLALLTRGLCLYFGPWQDPNRAKNPDTNRFLILAENLRRYHTFGMHEEEGLPWRLIAEIRAGNGTLPPADANGLRPESLRTPGYPLFLAAIESCGGSLRAILLAQCLLGGLLCYPVMVIAWSLRLRPLGVYVTGLLWAVHPALVVYDNVLLSEAAFNGAAILALYLATRESGRWPLFGSGCLLGAAALVRPFGLYYLPAALALAWPSPRPRRQLLWLLAPACLAAGGWMLRNWSVGEGPNLTSTVNLTALYHAAAYTRSEARGEDWLEHWQKEVRALAGELQEQVQPGEDVYAAAGRLARQQMLAHPVAAGRVFAKALIQTLISHSTGQLNALLGIPYQPTGLFSKFVFRETANVQSPPLAVVLVPLLWMLLNVSLVLGGLAACVRLLRRREWRLLLVAGATVVIFAVATLPAGGLERYRLPFMLPLFLLNASWFGVQRVEPKPP